MNNKVRMLVAGFGFGIAAGAVPVAADTFYSASGACSYSASIDDFRNNFDGDLDFNGTTGIEHRLSCGLIRPNAAASTTDDLNVYFEDRNAGTNMEDNVICSVRNCNPTGSTCTTESTLFGNGFGGTPTSGGTYTGVGFTQFTNLDRAANSTTVLSCAIPNRVGAAPAGSSGLLRIQFIHP